MESLIITALETCGFTTISLIDYDKDGKRKSLIAYFPKKACFVQVIANDNVNSSKEKLLLRISGQFTDNAVVNYLEHLNKIEKEYNQNVQGICNIYCAPCNWGEFQWTHKGELKSVLERIELFTINCAHHLGTQFTCNHLLAWFVARFKCNNGFGLHKAKSINAEIIKKLPAEIFSSNTKFIT